MKSLILITMIVGLILSGCGKQAEEAQKALELMKDLPEKAKQMEKDVNLAEKKKEERRQRGDTLAMPYKKLQEYLPKSIDRYGDAKFAGESVNMGVFSMSNARADYEKQIPDGASDRLTVELVDYNENYGLYAGLAFWLSGYSVENDERYEKTFNTGIDNVWALEKFQKNNGDAELMYAISWRFVLTLRANNQKDTEYLKSVIKKINISELAKM